MDLQTYRETSLQTWDEMAPGWEDRREWILGITGADQRVAGRPGRPPARPDDPRRGGRHRATSASSRRSGWETEGR